MAQTVKHLPAVQEIWVHPWVREDSRSGKWQPTPVDLPGESHGKRSLEGYSAWGHKSQTRLSHTHTHTHTHTEKSAWNMVSLHAPALNCIASTVVSSEAPRIEDRQK